MPFYSVRVVANSEKSYADAIAQLRRGLAWSRVGNHSDREIIGRR